MDTAVYALTGHKPALYKASGSHLQPFSPNHFSSFPPSMHFTTFSTVASSFVVSSFLGVALAGVAPQIFNNPKDVVAVAQFPKFGCGLMEGYVLFETVDGGKVDLRVDVTKLPPDGGPFHYHIHEFPVPADGDCEKVGREFNPYHASPDCDDQPGHGYCQLGDLSGKHGCITKTCFDETFCDSYLSLDPSSKASILGRSVVFHYNDMTKIACSNIELVTYEQLERLQGPSYGDDSVDVVYDKRDESNDEAPTTTFKAAEMSETAASFATDAYYTAGESGESFVTKVLNATYAGNRSNVSNLNHESACTLEGSGSSVKTAFATIVGIVASFFL